MNEWACTYSVRKFFFDVVLTISCLSLYVSEDNHIAFCGIAIREGGYVDSGAKGKSMSGKRRAHLSRKRVRQNHDTNHRGNGAPSLVEKSTATSAAPKIVDGHMLRSKKVFRSHRLAEGAFALKRIPSPIWT